LCRGLLLALFTNCSLLCRGCCSLYLQTVPCCAGDAVRFIYKLFLDVQGLLFALFTKSSLLFRGCCSLCSPRSCLGPRSPPSGTTRRALRPSRRRRPGRDFTL
jgi:hypothetical protein